MNKKKPIKRKVSIKAYRHLLEQLEANPPTFIYEKDAFIFLLDLLYRLPAFNRDLVRKESGFIGISRSYFQAYISNDYRLYIDYLIGIGLYECDGSYDTDLHISMGYRLNPVYEDETMDTYIMPGTTIWRKITQNFNKKNHKRLSDMEKKMKKYLQEATSDYDFEAAAIYLRGQKDGRHISQTQFNVLQLSLDTLKEKRIYLRRNKTNFRVDSNVTNMKKELRHFLSGYTQVDLVCSQPYLLNHIIGIASELSVSSSSSVCPVYVSSCGVFSYGKPLYASLVRLFKEIKNPPIVDPEEAKKYNDLTRTGLFYELFMPYLNLDMKKTEKERRKETKTRVLGSLYAPNGSFTFHTEQAAFKKEFPTIARLLHNLKRKSKHKDYSDLAVTLQLLEAEIFIDNIADRLYQQNVPVITVHDSIILKDEYVDVAMVVVEQVFMQYFGEIPSFKIENLGPEHLDKNVSLAEDEVALSGTEECSVF